MKKQSSAFLKQFVYFLTSIVKAKTMAVKNKTNAFKARLLIFHLLRNKKVLMGTINHKIQAIMGENYNKAIVSYNNAVKKIFPSIKEMEDVELNEEDDYPDLRYSLIELNNDGGDEEDEVVNGTGSVIDFVRSSKEDGNGVSLEDEIDHIADVFIKRFYRQMRMNS